MNGKGKYTMLERSILMFFLLFGNLSFKGFGQEEIGIINAPLQFEDSIRLNELEEQLRLFSVTGESQDSFLLVLQKYKQIAFKSRCVKPITAYYKMKGYSFHFSSAFDSAMWYFNKGIEISEKLNYRFGIVKCNSGLAICEYIKGNYNRTIGIDLENLEYFKENLDYTNMAITCGNLGISYSDFQLPDKALMYELLALKYAEWGHDSLIIASIYDQLGRSYTSLRDYNRANYYLTLCEKMSLNTNNRSSLAGVYYSFANLYSAKGDYNKAIELNGKAMLLFEDMEELFEQVLCYLQLASVELRLNHRQAAFKNILKSEELSISIKDSITLMNTYKLKYEYFKKYGDEKSALKAFEDYSYIKDIFYMVNNKRNYGSYVLEGEMKARTQKLVEKNLRNELEIVKGEKEIGMAAAKVKRLYFTVALTFLSMLLIIIIFLFIFKSKRNRLVRDHLMEMVQVQENERNRISKYLHDNVGHYLVLLRSKG
ncbi:MAG: hypothetical protein QM534_11750 [Sediminibacterium sp.]|nr:hypothetical protein [Sediminibacterium sp.]